MSSVQWRAHEDGADIHMPDPTGLTNGVTVVLPPAEVEAIYTTMRAAQLGADSTGSL